MLRINVCDSLIWILNEYKCIVINTDYCESLSHTIWLQETLKKKAFLMPKSVEHVPNISP